MRRHALRSLLASFLAYAAVSPASALTWKVDFIGVYFAQGGDRPLAWVNAVLTTEDVQSDSFAGVSGYRITGFSGNRNGVAITSVLTQETTSYTGPLGWPNSPFLRWDRGFFDWFGDFGFGYQTADGMWYNLNSFGDTDGNNGSDRQLSDITDPDSEFITQNGVINIVPLATAVPEPASWALTIAGVGLVGGMMRRRPRVRTTVTYA